MPTQSRIGKYFANWLQSNLPKPEIIIPKDEKISTKEMPYSVTGRGYMFEEYNSPNTLGQMQSYEGWVYACVNKIAQTCAQTQLNLFEQKSDGAEQIKRHNAIDLIEKANEFMTLYDLIELTFIYLGLTGEAYWYKERGQGGQVIGLYPWFSPAHMRVVPGNDKFISGFVYRVPETGEEVPFNGEDIVYFRFPDPLRRYRGMSPLKAAAMDVDTENKAKRFNWNFFKNSARPGGVLKTDKTLTQEVFDRIKVQFDNNHKGTDNAYRTALLEQGLDYQEVGFSHVDMDFIQQRTFSRDAILAIFGTPKAVLGIVEDVNRASAEASRYTFLKETITPLLRKFVGTLNEQLIVPDFGEELFFDFADLTPEDEEKKLLRYTSGLQQGWMSANEVREQEGLNSVQGADNLYVPFNMTAVASTDQVKAKKVMPQNVEKKYRTKKQIISDEMEKQYQKRNQPISELLKKKQKKTETKSPKCRIDGEGMTECMGRKIPEIMNEDPTLDEDQAVAIASSYCKIPCSKKETQPKESPFNEKQKQRIFEIFDIGIRKQVPEYKKKILNILSLMEKGVLKNFRNKKMFQSKSNRGDVKPYLLDKEEFIQVFVSEMLNMVLGTVEQTEKTTAGLFGLKGSIPDEMGYLFAKKAIEKFAKSTIDTHNELLANSLIEGLEQGDSIFDLRNRVKDVFSTMDNISAERIARTELTRITSWADEELYRQSGVAFKEWSINPGACEYCLTMVNKIISIDESFFEKGTQVFGRNGGQLSLDYETVERPPLHPNCTCYESPVGIGVDLDYSRIPLPSPE